MQRWHMLMAYKGENKKAIENAQKAVRLKPLKMDAWQGY